MVKLTERANMPGIDEMDRMIREAKIARVAKIA